jgi:hypothetical protein
MAQRVYLVVLDDLDSGKDKFDWFENFMRDEVLAGWEAEGPYTTMGFSAMDHVGLTVTAEDADEDYPEGSEVYPEDYMDEMADTVKQLQEQIREQIRRSKS